MTSLCEGNSCNGMFSSRRSERENIKRAKSVGNGPGEQKGFCSQILDVPTYFASTSTAQIQKLS